MGLNSWILQSLLASGLLFFIGEAVDIENIRLAGGSNNYINVQSSNRYSLLCKFRAGYDEEIQDVRWFKDGRLVYSWPYESPSSSAYQALAGRVQTSGAPNLQNLHFTRLSLDLSGAYTCEVRSKENTMSKPYQLVVLDIPSNNFGTSVSLLEDVEEPTFYNDTESDTNSNNFNCTLVWEFHTPAIYPRPNVTCGYYSYLLDDVAEEVPAGLILHNLNNGSWQAGFEHTYIKISEIPKESRLGCSVSVPETDFKRVVKFEDNFAIDHLIDSEGCPSVALDPRYSLLVDIEGGSFNCRGDLVPTSNTDLLKATFSCPRGHLAAFSNGSAFYGWRMEMYCNPRDMSWTTEESLSSRSPSTNLTNLPMCIPVEGSGMTPKTTSYILSSFPLLWTILQLR